LRATEKQRGVLHQWRGKTYASIYVPKVKVEIIVPDRQMKKLVDAIVEVCRSGSVGDGKNIYQRRERRAAYPYQGEG